MAYIDDVYLVVNIAPVGIPTYVRLSQNENGRRLYFAVTGGEIPSGSTATMSGTKPDGVVYSKTGSISGNTVTFNEDVQLTAVAGEWPAKIVIVNGGETVMTARIRFVIDADTVAAGAVPSDSQLEGLVAQAAAYAEAAKDGAFYGSPLVASTVAEMTDKTRVYVYTGSESVYTSGNWYYWNGSAWTSGGVYNATAVSTDTTLSVAGKAADAKATGDAIAAVTIPTDKTLTVSDAPADAKVVGDEIADLKDELSDIEEEIAEIEPGLSDEAKQALLMCFRHMPFLDDDADYYGALEAALYPSVYPMITAVYDLSQHIPCTADSLNDLKQYLTVTYYETESSAGHVVSSANYTLLGNMVEGIQRIKVFYGQLETSFVITVKESFPGSVTHLISTAIRIIDECTYINSTANAQRATLVSGTGDNKVKYAEGTTVGADSPYYAFKIPVGATGVQLDNSIETFYASSLHIVHWDSTVNAYRRDVPGEFQWTAEIVDVSETKDVTGLKPIIYDVSEYNDGNYYIISASAKTTGRTYFSDAAQMVRAVLSNEATGSDFNQVRPHFLYD